jgi:hypothetical protein
MMDAAKMGIIFNSYLRRPLTQKLLRNALSFRKSQRWAGFFHSIHKLAFRVATPIRPRASRINPSDSYYCGGHIFAER